jgi:putative Mg2+ transporter-C (MgtC) family protein
MHYLGGLPQEHLGHVFGLVAAVVFGALIGFERQVHGHPGLHTNALVALGAAAFVVADALIGDRSGQVRIAGQVATGVGFLCAGVIMHKGATVRGINTAATVWCSAAVGVLAGFGMILWAGLVAVILVFANVVLHRVEHQIIKFQPNGSGETARDRPDSAQER